MDRRAHALDLGGQLAVLGIARPLGSRDAALGEAAAAPNAGPRAFRFTSSRNGLNDSGGGMGAPESQRP